MGCRNCNDCDVSDGSIADFPSCCVSCVAEFISRGEFLLLLVSLLLESKKAAATS
jgi:hypothetical protein